MASFSLCVSHPDKENTANMDDCNSLGHVISSMNMVMGAFGSVGITTANPKIGLAEFLQE
jgi:hypothetical protein